MHEKELDWSSHVNTSPCPALTVAEVPSVVVLESDIPSARATAPSPTANTDRTATHVSFAKVFSFILSPFLFPESDKFVHFLRRFSGRRGLQCTRRTRPKATSIYPSRCTTKLAAPRNGGYSSRDSVPDKRSAVHSQKERMPALAIKRTSTS